MDDSGDKNIMNMSGLIESDINAKVRLLYIWFEGGGVIIQLKKNKTLHLQ